VAPGAPDPVPIKQGVIGFGGNPTGRASKFQFPAGTPQGDEERRKHEAERKKAARAVAAKVVQPPPLPSAVDGPGASPLNGADTVTGGPAAPVETTVPWDADTLRELTDEIVNGFEEGRVGKHRQLAVEFGLSDKLSDKLAANAKYKPPIKRSLQKTAPHVTANLANRLLPGSGKYSMEGVFLMALLANFVHGRKQLAETRRIIEEELAKEKKSQGGPGPGEAHNLSSVVQLHALQPKNERRSNQVRNPARRKGTGTGSDDSQPQSVFSQSPARQGVADKESAAASVVVERLWSSGLRLQRNDMSASEAKPFTAMIPQLPRGAKHQIYCDTAGQHYVLLEQRMPEVWLAIRAEHPSLCFLTRFNLDKLQLVGHAQFA